MIKRIRSKLSVKVFLLTAALMAVCCGITYVCIVRFAPYIYTHELSEAEMLTEELSLVLEEIAKEDLALYMADYSEFFAEYLEDEFVFHVFDESGRELAMPKLDSGTGKQIEDYAHVEKTEYYTMHLMNTQEEYTVFASYNTGKESQVVEALQKSLPVLSIVIAAISVIAAFFYTWYVTRPIRQVSQISRQMADMDFGGQCNTGRTDEIGVLSNSLNELSGKLSTALAQLQDANQKLQADIDRERQLERQRLAFFSAASHELKTPITIIRGQLEGMLYRVGRYRDRDTYLAQALEVTGALEHMVQELLVVSRLDEPGYVCSKSDVDLSALIDERLSASEALFVQRSLTVKAFLSPGIHIMGDRLLLQKAVDNLLGNAAMYSPEDHFVRVKLWAEQEVHVTVENTGVHIQEEELPRLFEAFYRVDPSRSRQTGGSGLGLYIVKTILDLHGAQVEIRNTQEGVMVSVRFQAIAP